MSKPSKYHFDFIIVGNGLAGLQLALAFSEDNFFDSKSIALIDSDTKSTNDKTWCFWEIGKGKWESIVSKSWSKSKFISPSVEITNQLDPYTYKMVHSLDFYRYAKTKLKAKANFKFILDSIKDVSEKNDGVKVQGDKRSYSAKHVFDSRVPHQFKEDTHCTKLQQHFEGRFIETSGKHFNVDEFTVMDYRIRHKNSTSFIYVLPITEKSALIEYTFFTPELVEATVYDIYIEKYISDVLGIDEYKINEIEKGNIPMTDFNFEKFNTSSITKIGTGGGWVKGSTGYSFKHTEIKVEKIINNIKAGLVPSHNLSKSRFKFYDSIFLKVLHDNNQKGMAVFEDFYSKNSVKDTFEFLDEQTNFLQELKIMYSMYRPEFVKAFINYIIKRTNKI